MARPGHFEIVTPPEAEPIELAEAKKHARVEHDEENSLIAGLIVAARSHVEKACGLALLEQTWRATFDAWDAKGLKLRPHPVVSLDAVKVWDGEAFAEQDAVDFMLRKGRPALVTLAYATPTPVSRIAGGIQIEFTAGFGEAADVPSELKLAMLQLIAHWYENREPTAVSANLAVVGTIPHQVRALLYPWQSMRLA